MGKLNGLKVNPLKMIFFSLSGKSFIINIKVGSLKKLMSRGKYLIQI